jgi:hypothetical protein
MMMAPDFNCLWTSPAEFRWSECYNYCARIDLIGIKPAAGKGGLSGCFLIRRHRPQRRELVCRQRFLCNQKFDA